MAGNIRNINYFDLHVWDNFLNTHSYILNISLKNNSSRLLFSGHHSLLYCTLSYHSPAAPPCAGTPRRQKTRARTATAASGHVPCAALFAVPLAAQDQDAVQAENKAVARTRANRVKSELILHQGLTVCVYAERGKQKNVHNYAHNRVK